MARVATTRLSSKGQVVIPEEIRRRLGLKTSSQFVVVGNKDTIVLKAIAPPSMEEFERLLREARRQATIAVLKRSDITEAVRTVRANR